ncbi:MAG TPA: transglycosylase domain-containing protein [Gemmatimonadales bacterium]|nr:transglycosylase domain-containing protein [Gemmatimonadales bacterium]
MPRQPSRPPTPWRRARAWAGRHSIVAAALGLLALVGLATRYEARASWLQARYFTRQASQLTNEIGDGPSDRIRFPGDGPYDRRFGYARLPAALQTAAARGYRIAAQVRVSERFAELVDRGLSPIFSEKTQAGLRIVDRRGATIFESRYPERIYPSVDSVPPAVWQTLLFLENRALLDPRFPNHNPSVDWPRMAKAAADFALSWLGSRRSVPGASTLATQLEKFRHSTEGRTRSTREKLLQMEAASLRSYLGGENTEAARRRIVADYLNSVPLAAIAGHGEVTGLGDGLWAWYGADPDEVNRVLWEEARGGTASDSGAVARRAVAYRQVLSLMLAQRRPSYLLLQPEGRAELRERTDQHLRLVAREGIISAQLRDAALAVDLTPRSRAPDVPRVSFIERKGANAVRAELLGLTGVGTLYELDRFDLTARTTLDLPVQEAVTHLLVQLTDRAFVRQQGLASVGLLDRGDPARVIYAVVLHERTEEGNLVRVQVDNFDSPFNVIEGSKLEHGSTAKLRTLISYLEIVEELYRQHAGRPAVSLRAEPVGAGDGITAWTLAYLAANPGVSLERILQAAMSRPYSASPGESLTGGDSHAFRNINDEMTTPVPESFFTGGGTQTFRNVDTTDDQQAISVRDAFIRSVNLPFIRIMRDIVHYYACRLPGGARLLVSQPAEAPWDRDDSRREEDVARLADGDGRELIDHDTASVLAALGRGRSVTQLAWAYRSVTPEAGLEEFGAFFRHHVAPAPSDAFIAELYDGSDPTGFSISDRGHLAGMHPWELWLAGYLRRHPGALQPEALDASASVRREIYGGLFPPSRPAAPDWRIGSIPESEAFREISRSWRRLGYPFESLVPSYATAIGSSADRPDQLAELVGIVLSDGVRYPVRRVEELDFAAGTPYETRLRPSPHGGERVLSSEIAAVVRAAMVAVVARGTARRGVAAVRAVDGSPLPIGAKTGTGNNRYRVVGRDGVVLEDRAIDRTSTVVFFIGDRFYGTITAFVSGSAADRYGFTSSLPVQILKMLGPTLRPLIAGDARIDRGGLAASHPCGASAPPRSYTISCTSLSIPANDTGRQSRGPFSIKVQSALKQKGT